MAKRKKPAEPKTEAPPEGRSERGRFVAGVSGNPGGMPKGAADVRALARTFTKRAVERLSEWMESDNAKASVSAAVAILNRGWGMPTQNVKATVTHLRNMTDDELYGFLSSGADESGSSDGAFEAASDTGKPH